jgi:hypothetical protein
MRLYLELDRDEIHQKIPYAVICETRFGSRWNTMRRKRRWVEEFTEAERNSAERLFKMAHNWYLVKGVPDQIRLTPDTLMLWGKLGNFCASL